MGLLLSTSSLWCYCHEKVLQSRVSPSAPPLTPASLRTCYTCAFSGPSPHPLNQKAWEGRSISLILSPLEDDDTHLRTAVSVTDRWTDRRGMWSHQGRHYEKHATFFTKENQMEELGLNCWLWVRAEYGKSGVTESHAIPFPEAYAALEMMNNLLTPPRVRAKQQWRLTMDSHWILHWPYCRQCLVTTLLGSLHPSRCHTCTNGVLWGLHQLQSIQIGFEALLTVWPWASCASVSLTAGWDPGLVSWPYLCSQSLWNFP